MSILYLVFAFTDLLLLIIGNVIDKQEDYVDFYCVEDWYLLYFKTPSVIFVLFHNLFFCLFSIQIWYIFYRLPYIHGLIEKPRVENLRMTTNFKSTLSINKLKESEVLEEFVKGTQASEITPAMSPLLRKTSMDGHGMQKSLVSPKF